MKSDTTVASPCIKECELNAEKVCKGCLRTIEEIIDWPTMSNARKRKTLACCEERQEHLEQ